VTLNEFLNETRAEIAAQMSDGSQFAELVFCEVVMQHLAEAGMTFEPVVCHYTGKVGNATLRLSGYALSDDQDQLDLFVSLFGDYESQTPVADQDCKKAAEHCLRFVEFCANGRLAGKVDPSHDVHSLALTVHEIYNDLDQIRIFVLTDGVAKSKNFKTREVNGKAIRLEVMDIERLFRHRSEGKPRDELLINFVEFSGTPLPCVFIPGQSVEYDYALTALPGEALRKLYEKFGARLLEANVRSFLSIRGKGVNAGIQKTLREDPERFMAFNNGVVIVADDIQFERSIDGSLGISGLRGLQIVNGGQTTAAIYFTKRKFPEADITKVRVPAKIVIIKSTESAKEDDLIASISRFANSQNAVRQSDLSANKPFHIELERQSLSIYCPDGVGQWFYERATGSYNTQLERQRTTPAKLKVWKEAVPMSRRITKTDMAKYLMAWDGKADIVSLGSQKCFDRFMAMLEDLERNQTPLVPDADFFKNLVAKAILFKSVHKIARPLVHAFLANVTAYTVGLIAETIGENFRLGRVWQNQAISSRLEAQTAIWAREVNARLHDFAGGRMISEVAKRPECRDEIFSKKLSAPVAGIPEVGS
jgi:hypothetical protein